MGLLQYLFYGPLRSIRMTKSGNIQEEFSFQTFSAYFLPGLLLTSGLFMVTKLCRLHNYSSIPPDSITAILFVLISLIAGIIFSSVSDQLNNFIYWLLRIAKPTRIFLLKELQGEFIEAFRTEFKIRLKRSAWCEEYFLLVKELVDQRRSSVVSPGMTLLKGNLILPIILWSFNGIFFSLEDVARPQSQLVLLLSSLAGGYLLAISLWLNMHRNAVNEVRQTMIAFVALSKSGTTKNDFGIFY
jgi:hypothetical protein